MGEYSLVVVVVVAFFENLPDSQGASVIPWDFLEDNKPPI